MQAFYSSHPSRKVAKGEIILHRGDVPSKVYAVKRGIITIYSVTSSGEERFINFRIKNDIFPDSWAYSKSKESLFYYQAHTDSEIYLIDRAEFTNHVQLSPKFSRDLLNNEVNAHVTDQLRFKALTHSKAIDKLLHTLRYLCLRYGRDISANHVRINIPLTQQDLANLTGLTRETIVGEVNKLRNKGLIEYKHMSYVVDTTKLNDFIDEDYNPGIDINVLPHGKAGDG